jgi:hypothetical protein
VLDPLEKLQLYFFDGLDVEMMVNLNEVSDRDWLRLGHSGDQRFRGCGSARRQAQLDPISIVCKVRYVTNARRDHLGREALGQLREGYGDGL